ncbi:alpha/beta fold hydrolase [Shimazuella kribbensis]|uniref:alpha/beta fold hydrolase n=1 Tax=Shimazuella kribbensis TaxID=139808 RepID=UPI0003FBF310|nr:alpha/beta hydrolase [Shimazuella kribbensis]
MTLKTLQTNKGTTIAFEDLGQGKPIILVHGFVGDHHYWDHVMEPLAKKYRVIAIDLPGHGNSALSSDTNTTEDYADEIANLVEQLRLDKITLVGHSLGGYITMAFSKKYASMLDRFALIHSTALPDTEEAKAGRLAGIEKIKTEGLQPFVDGLIPKLFAPAYLADFEQTTKEIGYGASPQGAIAALGAMRNRPNLTDVLATTSVPVLIVAGSEDVVVPTKRAFSTEGQNIEQVVIPSVGHMSMYEAPDQLVEKLTHFFH